MTVNQSTVLPIANNTETNRVELSNPPNFKSINITYEGRTYRVKYKQKDSRTDYSEKEKSIENIVQGLLKANVELKKSSKLKITHQGILHKKPESGEGFKSISHLSKATFDPLIKAYLQTKSSNTSAASSITRTKRGPSFNQDQPGNKQVRLDPNKKVHLLLTESYTFTSLYFDKLIEKIKDHPGVVNKEEAVQSLQKSKKQTLEKLVGQETSIYKDENWNRSEGINKKIAEKEWSSKAEKTRQAKTRELLNTALYDGLAFVEHTLKSSSAPITQEQLHRDIGIALANTKSKNMLHEGKIDIKYRFYVETDQNKKFDVIMHTQQFGSVITTSLEPRIPKADPNFPNGEKKLYAVNIHIEQATFKDYASGQEFTSSQLRSGSFDFHTRKKEGETYQLPPLESVQKAVIKFTKQISECENDEKKIQEIINKIRIGKNPKRFGALIHSLNDYKDSIDKDSTLFKKWSEKIVKYTAEYERMYGDAITIKKGKACMVDVFETLKGPEGEKVGITIPEQVREIYRKNRNFDDSQLSVGMISLQTPVNISEKGINKQILRIIRNKKIWSKIRKPFEKLASQDMSELDPIYRELQVFEEAKNKAKLRHGLYFNIPTNFMGKDRIILNLGPYSLSFRLSNQFNTGLVDKYRSKIIQDVTQKSQQTVYDLSIEAQNLIKADMDKDISSKDKAVLQRFLNTLEDLTDQTFKQVGKEGSRPVVKMQSDPGTNANYEIVCRLTTLMQLLNIKTTGHCRSGNNRTAAWLAKGFQIDVEIADSEDGRIPTPAETAGRLAKRNIAAANKNKPSASSAAASADKNKPSTSSAAASAGKNKPLISSAAASEGINKPSTSSAAASEGINKPSIPKTLGMYLKSYLPLKKRPQDPWSLQVFLNCFKTSITLQDSNKGTKGTKLDLAEIKNKNLRAALFQGAFKLAGRFEPKQAEKARDRLQERQNAIITY